MSTEEVWNQYGEDVLGYFSRKTNDPELASDLRQEVFLRVHQRLGSLREHQKTAHWLSAISRNVLVDHWKQKGRERSSVLLPKEHEDGSLHRMADVCIQNMIKTLPEKYAGPLAMGDLEGVKQQQIAEQYQITLSGAKSRIQRGRVMLKEAIQNCCKVELNKRNELVDADCVHDDCGCSD